MHAMDYCALLGERKVSFFRQSGLCQLNYRRVKYRPEETERFCKDGNAYRLKKPCALGRYGSCLISRLSEFVYAKVPDSNRDRAAV